MFVLLMSMGGLPFVKRDGQGADEEADIWEARQGHGKRERRGNVTIMKNNEKNN